MLTSLALGGLLLGLVSGCGGQGVSAAGSYKDPHPLPPDTLQVRMAEVGTYGGRFVLGTTASPKSFNALLANETSTTDVTERLFASVADFDNTTQDMSPRLAKSWETSADGLTWTWHLRRGARFSDGHPITSADYLFSLEVVYKEKPSMVSMLNPGGGPFEISAPDSYTVITKTKVPYAMMIPAMGSLRVMPKHILEPAFRRGEFASAYGIGTPPESLVTSGPWTLKEFVPNEKTVLARNPYWLGVDAKGQRLPYLDELVYLISPDQNTIALKFQAGEVDGLDNVKPEDYQRYEETQQQQGFSLHELGPSLNTNFMWFNLNKVRDPKAKKPLGTPYMDKVKYGWFSSHDFRRAVSKAIDRDAMIQSVFFGEAVKNWSIMTPGSKLWYTPEIAKDDYDLAGAKQLLAGLGWKDRDGDGFLEDTQGNTITFTLKTNGDNTLRMAMCNFIKDDLAKVGIRCVPTGVEFNTLVVNLREDFQYEAILLGLGSAVPPDPGMGQNVFRSSGVTHYWNMRQPKPETAAEAEIDRLIEANTTTTDMAERKRTWTEIQQIINRESFVVWLPTLLMKIPVRNRFGNLEPSVIPHRLLWNIERVYVKAPGRVRV